MKKKPKIEMVVDLFGELSALPIPSSDAHMSKYQIFKKVNHYRKSESKEQRCKTCSNRRPKQFKDKRYNKCVLIGNSNSPATDIAKNHICDQYEEIMTIPENQMHLFEQPRFDGATYEKEFDQKRLGAQMYSVYDLMKDKRWRTLSEIAQITGYPEASISARLRDLRKERFGNHTVNRQRRVVPEANINNETGLFEYQLIIS